MTNGLGGFSSLTMIGSVTRSEHAVLMACTHAPNQRVNLVHRMEEKLKTGDLEYSVSSQEYADGTREEGYQYQSAFIYEDTPMWRFHINGVEICKEMVMKAGENAVGICYEICNRSRKPSRFVVTPFFRFAPKGKDDIPDELSMAMSKSGEIDMLGQMNPAGKKEIVRRIKVTGTIASELFTLYCRTNGKYSELPEKTESYFYAYDTCDGKKNSGSAKALFEISCDVAPGETRKLELIFEMEPSLDTVDQMKDQMKKSRRNAMEKSAFISDVARTLAKSALQFIAKRESTKGSTILAGFPFFEDWGRDTMVAFPGLCLSTGQYETGKEILRTFAVYEKDGLMPNLFPEGQDEAMYNTADAALLYINCVYLYYQATGDKALVRELYPVMERIVSGYRKGTGYAIHMDEDGLICAGKDLEQVTWMDVRVGEILPTPRHGKPVEINAYWYNALCVMDALGSIAGKSEAECRQYRELKELVKRSFETSFWMEERGYLKDVVSDLPEVNTNIHSGTKPDVQMRCNQIWAVSMPFTMLDIEKEKRIVDVVFEKLYTPYGLRTLEQNDEEFHPTYGGSMFERDMAYHQGTVWVYPLGGYYMAFLKVHGYSEEAKETVRGQLEVLKSALREGCIGQLPEIYDGKNPTSSRGCFAQAWSVGELLRVYEVVENRSKPDCV